tara:strand:- start:1672 stop:1953 length:282 start_codon:yes stop_codon:yes gene_type:complete
MQRLLWIGTILDLILFLPALYLSGLDLGAAGFSGGPTHALYILLTVVLLPVLCILAPGLAWKRFDRASPRAALFIVLVPFAYAALLAAYLFFL